jgi:putative tricarboxylic transport membrane protein
MDLRYPGWLSICWLLGASVQAAPQPLDALEIVVPGAPGGGFDKSAQAVARALKKEGLVHSLKVRQSPGAGGLIALAQFESSPPPAEPSILIGGTSILGAGAENHPIVMLGDLVPIVQLNEIALVIAVRADSPVRSLGDLLELMRGNASRFEWVGGSLGSPDEVLLWALAGKLHLDRHKLVYISAPGGGAQVPERLIKGGYLAAISSYEEFAPFGQRQQLRMLAVSSAERIPGNQLPTLRESGLDLVFNDWKGVFVKRTTPPEERAKLEEIFAALLVSPAWREELQQHGWRPVQRSGNAFASLIAADQQRIDSLLSAGSQARESDTFIRELLVRPYRFSIAALAAAGLLLCAVLVQRRIAVRQRRDLDQSLAELDALKASLVPRAPDQKDQIAGPLQRWGLSTAEIEIAWMILKGLSFKEIATARGTSERTVRQQAQAIYRKSGLPNRAEFSAYFLEDLRL